MDSYSRTVRGLREQLDSTDEYDLLILTLKSTALREIFQVVDMELYIIISRVHNIIIVIDIEPSLCQYTACSVCLLAIYHTNIIALFF